MREFLLCLLICCLSHLAFGQFIYYPNDKSKGSFTEQFEKHVKEKMDEFTIAAVRLWDEYSAECWADSTRHVSIQYYWVLPVQTASGGTDTICVKVEPVYYSTGGVDCPGANRTVETIYYTHRDPTFPGFMEFLKRKVKP